MSTTKSPSPSPLPDTTPKKTKKHCIYNKVNNSFTANILGNALMSGINILTCAFTSYAPSCCSALLSIFIILIISASKGAFANLSNIKSTAGALI